MARLCELRPLSVFLLMAALILNPMAQAVEGGQSSTGAQSAMARASSSQVDPLASLTRSFPHAIKVSHKGQLLEFCPDNTCDGFISSNHVPLRELKDFAFLYIYFFSGFTYLPDWRKHGDARSAVTHVLSNAEYRNCGRGDDIQSARCVLLHLSRGGRIKLIFVRYDENHRSVVPESIPLALKRSAPTR